jgi:hypothetical protein
VSWYVFVQFMHVLFAILAFGTAMLAFPFIGAFAAKDPTHLNFALRLNYALGRRAVTPLAVTTFLLGIGLVIIGEWDFFASEWLWVSTILFLVTVADAQLITLPALARLIALTSSSPSGGPSPEAMKLVRRVRLGGTLSGLLLAIIVLLMVWKPGAG